MRITTRLTLAWTLAGLLVFGGYGALLVRRERQDLMRSVEREMWLLGTSLQVAVENALRDGQFADVDETTRKLERIDASVDVAVFDRDGGLILTTGPTATAPIVAPTRPELRSLGEDVLALRAPLQEPGRAVFGTLVVARPLEDVQRDLAITTGMVALTVGIFVGTSGLLGWALGHRYIGAPLEALVHAMGEVRAGASPEGGSGELPPAAPPQVQEELDEIGVVAVEFEAMMRELEDARERLQEAADARRQLERALQQTDKLVTLGQLAATVAHEVGSPLQVLRGRADALLRSPADPDRVRRHAQILVRETDRIARIVEQLLAMTRPRPARGLVDLGTLIRQSVELYELEARRHGIQLDVEVAPDGQVIGNPDRLLQIVTNLLANALAATESGGRVLVALRLEEPWVVVEVGDTGLGMAPEVAERAFEPFFTTRPEQGGTGLGLAVVKGIVDEHGGRIEVETAQSAGTTLRILLPRGER